MSTRASNAEFISACDAFGITHSSDLASGYAAHTLLKLLSADGSIVAEKYSRLELPPEISSAYGVGSANRRGAEELGVPPPSDHNPKVVHARWKSCFLMIEHCFGMAVPFDAKQAIYCGDEDTAITVVGSLVHQAKANSAFRGALKFKEIRDREQAEEERHDRESRQLEEKLRKEKDAREREEFLASLRKPYQGLNTDDAYVSLSGKTPLKTVVNSGTDTHQDYLEDPSTVVDNEVEANRLLQQMTTRNRQELNLPRRRAGDKKQRENATTERRSAQKYQSQLPDEHTATKASGSNNVRRMAWNGDDTTTDSIGRLSVRKREQERKDRRRLREEKEHLEAQERTKHERERAYKLAQQNFQRKTTGAPQRNKSTRERAEFSTPPPQQQQSSSQLYTNGHQLLQSAPPASSVSRNKAQSNNEEDQLVVASPSGARGRHPLPPIMSSSGSAIKNEVDPQTTPLEVDPITNTTVTFMTERQRKARLLLKEFQRSSHPSPMRQSEHSETHPSTSSGSGKGSRTTTAVTDFNKSSTSNVGKDFTRMRSFSSVSYNSSYIGELSPVMGIREEGDEEDEDEEGGRGAEEGTDEEGNVQTTSSSKSPLTENDEGDKTSSSSSSSVTVSKRHQGDIVIKVDAETEMEGTLMQSSSPEAPSKGFPGGEGREGKVRDGIAENEPDSDALDRSYHQRYNMINCIETVQSYCRYWQSKQLHFYQVSRIPATTFLQVYWKFTLRERLRKVSPPSYERFPSAPLSPYCDRCNPILQVLQQYVIAHHNISAKQIVGYKLVLCDGPCRALVTRIVAESQEGNIFRWDPISLRHLAVIQANIRWQFSLFRLDEQIHFNHVAYAHVFERTPRQMEILMWVQLSYLFQQWKSKFYRPKPKGIAECERCGPIVVSLMERAKGRGVGSFDSSDYLDIMCDPCRRVIMASVTRSNVVRCMGLLYSVVGAFSLLWRSVLRKRRETTTVKRKQNRLQLKGNGFSRFNPDSGCVRCGPIVDSLGDRLLLDRREELIAQYSSIMCRYCKRWAVSAVYHLSVYAGFRAMYRVVLAKKFAMKWLGRPLNVDVVTKYPDCFRCSHVLDSLDTRLFLNCNLPQREVMRYRDLLCVSCDNVALQKITSSQRLVEYVVLIQLRYCFRQHMRGVRESVMREQSLVETSCRRCSPIKEALDTRLKACPIVPRTQLDHYGQIMCRRCKAQAVVALNRFEKMRAVTRSMQLLWKSVRLIQSLPKPNRQKQALYKKGIVCRRCDPILETLDGRLSSLSANDVHLIPSILNNYSVIVCDRCLSLVETKTSICLKELPERKVLVPGTNGRYKVHPLIDFEKVSKHAPLIQALLRRLQSQWRAAQMAMSRVVILSPGCLKAVRKFQLRIKLRLALRHHSVGPWPCTRCDPIIQMFDRKFAKRGITVYRAMTEIQGTFTKTKYNALRPKDAALVSAAFKKRQTMVKPIRVIGEKGKPVALLNSVAVGPKDIEKKPDSIQRRKQLIGEQEDILGTGEAADEDEEEGGDELAPTHMDADASFVPGEEGLERTGGTVTPARQRSSHVTFDTKAEENGGTEVGESSNMRLRPPEVAEAEPKDGGPSASSGKTHPPVDAQLLPATNDHFGVSVTLTDAEKRSAIGFAQLLCAVCTEWVCDSETFF